MSIYSSEIRLTDVQLRVVAVFLMICSGVALGVAIDPSLQQSERMFAVACAVAMDIVAFIVACSAWPDHLMTSSKKGAGKTGATA